MCAQQPPGTSEGDIEHSAGRPPAPWLSAARRCPLTSGLRTTTWPGLPGSRKPTSSAHHPRRGTSSGVLVDYDTGSETPASVTITASGDPFVQTASITRLRPTPAPMPTTLPRHRRHVRPYRLSAISGTWYADPTITGLTPAAPTRSATSANLANPAIPAGFQIHHIGGRCGHQRQHLRRND